jgi:hypothetical protein
MREAFSTTPSLSLKYTNFILGQRLCENVNNLLVCRNVLEPHCSLLYHVSDVVVLDLNVLDLSWKTGFSESFTQL